MTSNVAIKVIVQDDQYNSPELQIATTFIVKVPLHADLDTISQEIEKRYQVLAFTKNLYYYIDDEGEETYFFFDSVINDFWRYVEGITEGFGELYVDARFEEYPTEICSICNGSLHGAFSSCDCGLFQACFRYDCMNSEENKCPFHGREFLRNMLI